jgi:RsiW-degrading membrane proteinase PrsW (M82 family)
MKQKIIPVLCVLTGLVLVSSGLLALIGYLGLPFLDNIDPLISQLGQMAAMFLGLVGGGLALFHGISSLARRRSRAIWFPPVYFFWVVFAVVLGLGNLLLNRDIAAEFIFPFLFALGAALPALAVLAYACRRLGFPVTWRQGSLGFVSGSTLSVMVALILEMILPVLLYELFDGIDSIYFDFLFDSGISINPIPGLIFFLLMVAFQAPIPEEFAKALGPALFGRRIQNERQAFAVGLASGAGFAILENMLYEGIYAYSSDWTWGGITLLRGFGSVLHPLGTGIIALALFREREHAPGWKRRLTVAFFTSVGLHTLWNGGFDLLYFFTGPLSTGLLDETLWIYGTYTEALLIVYLVILSSALWLLLKQYTARLSTGEEIQVIPQVISWRILAAWALLCMLVIVPIGAALSPAWSQIAAAFAVP